MRPIKARNKAIKKVIKIILYVQIYHGQITKQINKIHININQLIIVCFTLSRFTLFIITIYIQQLQEGIRYTLMKKQSVNAYEFINQACSLLSNFSDDDCDFMKMIKVKSHQIKTTTKMIMSHEQTSYTRIVTQQKLTSLQLQSNQILKNQSKIFFEQLFRNRIKGIGERVKVLLDLDKNVSENDSKFIIFSIVEELDSEYEDLHRELQEAKRYRKNSQLKDVIDTGLLKPTIQRYVTQIYTFLPKLKEYFEGFPYSILTVEQLEQLTTYSVTKQMVKVDLNQLLKQKLSIHNKKKKKKNKKKAKKQAEDTETKQSENQEAIQENEQANRVIEFLKGTVIQDHRLKCCVTESWLQSLRSRFGNEQ